MNTNACMEYEKRIKELGAYSFNEEIEKEVKKYIEKNAEKEDIESFKLLVENFSTISVLLLDIKITTKEINSLLKGYSKYKKYISKKIPKEEIEKQKEFFKELLSKKTLEEL